MVVSQDCKQVRTYRKDEYREIRKRLKNQESGDDATRIGNPLEGQTDSDFSVENNVDESKPNTVPVRIGGFRLIKQIGLGGMGTVFRAKQVSLDREVAIKILRPRCLKNPNFLARFTREAFAAAQLIHHNMVQIYDIGSQDDIHYFSMELVHGESLHQILKEKEKLDVDTSVGYALQAARGLHFAHEQGMVHRDIKPSNLMLNKQGIIKVADLGLVRVNAMAELPAGSGSTETVGSSRLSSKDQYTTQMGMSVGTPAFMSPEQWLTPEVDGRADIYSLGCTLYTLVTGQLAFTGRTHEEISSKHRGQLYKPVKEFVRDVPDEFVKLLLKMMHPDVSQRFQSMGEVIKALERYLGVASKANFTPEKEQVALLEKSIDDYNSASWSRYRSATVRFLTIASLICVALGFFFSLGLLAGASAFLLTMAVTYFLMGGLFEKTHLFTRLKEFVFNSRPLDWVTWLVGAGVLSVVALVSNQLWPIGMGAVFGLIFGVLLYVVFDRVLSRQRDPAIDNAQSLFKTMRQKGCDEDAIRQFVCRYGGRDWEEFYEALFGYTAKLDARHWITGESGKLRRKFRTWREPVIRAIDSSIDRRQQKREIAFLQKVEFSRLLDQGMAEDEAKKQARAHARRTVNEKAELSILRRKKKRQKAKLESQQHAIAAQSPSMPLAETAPELDVKHQLEQSDSNASGEMDPSVSLELSNRGLLARIDGVLYFLFGPRIRFFAGAILLTLCLLWMHQNNLFQQLRDSEGTFDGAMLLLNPPEEVEPFSISFVDSKLTDWIFGYRMGLAGILLIASTITMNWIVTPFMLISVVVLMFGERFGLPLPKFTDPEHLMAILGAGIGILGIAVCRLGRKEN